MRKRQRLAILRGCIYVLRFPSGAVYVGATLTPRIRTDKHLALLRAGRHPNARLQAEWDRTRGAGVAVDRRTVAVVDVAELVVCERVCIRTQVEERGRDRVLNRSLGSGAASFAGSFKRAVVRANAAASQGRGQKLDTSSQ